MPIINIKTGKNDNIKVGELIGPIDNSNKTYLTPDFFLYDPDNGKNYFLFFRSGQNQVKEQFEILRTGDKGYGVKVYRPPRKHESLVSSYVKY